MKRLAYYIAKKFTDYTAIKDENKRDKEYIESLKSDIYSLVVEELSTEGVFVRVKWKIAFREDYCVMFGESNNKLTGIISTDHERDI